jgi:hypothetical protein
VPPILFELDWCFVDKVDFVVFMKEKVEREYNSDKKSSYPCPHIPLDISCLPKK